MMSRAHGRYGIQDQLVCGDCLVNQEICFHLSVCIVSNYMIRTKTQIQTNANACCFGCALNAVINAQIISIANKHIA